jgi:hypothetical protein
MAASTVATGDSIPGDMEEQCGGRENMAGDPREGGSGGLSGGEVSSTSGGSLASSWGLGRAGATWGCRGGVFF